MGNLGQLPCTVICVRTRTRVHMCLWLPSRAREKGQVLALATVFVKVACGGSSSGQKACWEPLWHPNRPAWVTSSHHTFLGLWFRDSLSDYRRFQMCRSVFCSTFALGWTFIISQLKIHLHAQHSGGGNASTVCFTLLLAKHKHNVYIYIYIFINRVKEHAQH